MVARMRITGIAIERLVLPLDPPLHAAWDPVPRTSFEATLVRVQTDEGLVGVGSGDRLDGFLPYAGLLVGEDPRRLARHARTLAGVGLQAGRCLPVQAAVYDPA